MFEALAQSLAAGFQIWQHENKHKYVNELKRLRRKKREEESKPENEISDAVLDNLKFELCQLSLNFATEVGVKDAEDM